MRPAVPAYFTRTNCACLVVRTLVLHILGRLYLHTSSSYIPINVYMAYNTSAHARTRDIKSSVRGGLAAARPMLCECAASDAALSVPVKVVECQI